MLNTKDLLTLNELTSNEIMKIIDLGISFKKKNKDKIFSPLLKNKTMAMIFQKPSTRTRVSFETAMFQLGGYALYLQYNDLQLSNGESIEDTAKTLSKYVDIIMARVYDHKHIELLADNSSIPIINGLSNSFHPCQSLADLMTIKEKKGTFDNIKIAWIGDFTNVSNSLIYGCIKLQITMSIATTIDNELIKTIDIPTNNKIEISNDPIHAINDADVVITDTFVSMHYKQNNHKLNRLLSDFQVNSSLMEKAKHDAIFLHCLPAKRGHEVTSSVIDGPQSVIWDESENRLHVQKALLTSLNI